MKKKTLKKLFHIPGDQKNEQNTGSLVLQSAVLPVLKKFMKS